MNKLRLEHSYKGSTWKKGHKYLFKKNGKYYYKPENTVEGNLYYDPDNPDDVYDYNGNLVSKDDLDNYTYYKQLRDEDNNTIDKLKRKGREGVLITNKTYKVYGVDKYKEKNIDYVTHTKVENGKSWFSSKKLINAKYDTVVAKSKNGSVTRNYVSRDYVYTKGKIEQSFDKAKAFVKGLFNKKVNKKDKRRK